jgi:hypothetical protein
MRLSTAGKQLLRESLNLEALDSVLEGFDNSRQSLDDLDALLAPADGEPELKDLADLTRTSTARQSMDMRDSLRESDALSFCDQFGALEFDIKMGGNIDAARDALEKRPSVGGSAHHGLVHSRSSDYDEPARQKSRQRDNTEFSENHFAKELTKQWPKLSIVVKSMSACRTVAQLLPFMDQVHLILLAIPGFRQWMRM